MAAPPRFPGRFPRSPAGNVSGPTGAPGPPPPLPPPPPPGAPGSPVPFPAPPGWAPPGWAPPGAYQPYRGTPPARDPTPRFNRAAIAAFAFAVAAPLLGPLLMALLGTVIVLNSGDMEPAMMILPALIFVVLLGVLVALAVSAITGIRRTGEAGMLLAVGALAIGVPSLVAGLVAGLATQIGG